MAARPIRPPGRVVTAALLVTFQAGMLLCGGLIALTVAAVAAHGRPVAALAAPAAAHGGGDAGSWAQGGLAALTGAAVLIAALRRVVAGGVGSRRTLIAVEMVISGVLGGGALRVATTAGPTLPLGVAAAALATGAVTSCLLVGGTHTGA